MHFQQGNVRALPCIFTEFKHCTGSPLGKHACLHREEEEEGMSAGSSRGHAEAEEQEESEDQGQVFVMVGTGEARGQQAGGMWNPCKGRLLVMRIYSSQNGMSQLIEREDDLVLLSRGRTYGASSFCSQSVCLLQLDCW